MKKIAIFGINAKYKLGGTEASINRIYNELNKQYEVTIVSGKASIENSYDKYNYEQLQEIPTIRLKYFKFIAFIINYFRIFNHFKRNDFDLVLANGFSCQGAINSSIIKGTPTFYFVRDEFNLNTHVEYLKKTTLRGVILRKFKNIVEYPFFKLYCAKNKQAMKGCTHVIANSKFMSKLVKTEFDIQPVVIYPFINSKKKTNLASNKSKYITMIGNSDVKGISTFLKIASKLSEFNFRVVGRNLENRQVENVLYEPFYDDIDELYTTSKIILVPSIWQEAFGRVSVEASSLGVPVIVSDRGGLPETVPSNQLIVNEYENPDEWLLKIRQVLSNYVYWSMECKKYADEIDECHEMLKLQKLIDSIADSSKNDN